MCAHSWTNIVGLGHLDKLVSGHLDFFLNEFSHKLTKAQKVTQVNQSKRQEMNNLRFLCGKIAFFVSLVMGYGFVAKWGINVK